MLATGVEYALEDCAIVKFVIPPLELADGTLIKLRDAHCVFPPIRMLVNLPAGGQIQALFHPADGKWEIVSS